MLFKAVSHLLDILTSVSLTSADYNHFVSLTTSFNQAFDNWHKPVIINIIISDDNTCIQGFEQFFNYSYAGTSQGFFCQSYLMKWNQECKSKPTQPDVSRWISPSTFHGWGLNSRNLSKTICVQKYYSFNFYQNSTLFDGTSCLPGYNQCGGPALETIICIPKDILCPIDQIFIKKGLCDKSNPNCLVLDEKKNKTISWTRNSPNSLPIVETAVKEYAICFDSTIDNISPYRILYPLSNRKSSSCITEISSNYSWRILDTVNESYFYQTNGILASYNSLPENIETHGYNYYLFSRSYLKINYTCRSALADMEGTKPQQHTLSNTLYAIFYANSILMFLYFYIVWGYVQDFRSGESRHSEQLKSVKKVSNKIVGLFNFIVKLICYITSKQVLGKYDNFLSCSMDPTLNETISEIRYYFLRWSETTFILLVITCVISGVSITLSCIKKHNPYETN